MVLMRNKNNHPLIIVKSSLLSSIVHKILIGPLVSIRNQQNPLSNDGVFRYGIIRLPGGAWPLYNSSNKLDQQFMFTMT